MVSSDVVGAWADALLAVLLAPACAACGTPLDAPTRGAVCDGCWTRLVPIAPPACTTCAEPLPSWRVISSAQRQCARCRRRGTAIAMARAIGVYDGALRDIVHALKYEGRRSLAAPIAARMRTHGADVLDGADVVVPVPLHRTRLLRRGFNQAADLARQLGLPCRIALRRTRATASQTELPASRRHANVRDAFAVRRSVSLAGLCVVLVDDVSTTGATLEACARALRQAGAREVRALTAARAVSLRP
jgi:ComF family protein